MSVYKNIKQKIKSLNFKKKSAPKSDLDNANKQENQDNFSSLEKTDGLNENSVVIKQKKKKTGKSREKETDYDLTNDSKSNRSDTVNVSEIKTADSDIQTQKSVDSFESKDGNENNNEKIESDVSYSNHEVYSDDDVVVNSKLKVNNTASLKNVLKLFELPWSKGTFFEHLSVTTDEPTMFLIKDINNDTERDLAFYKQSLSSVVKAKSEFKKLKIPFRRPSDYFAEMLKSEEHMDKIKNKLIFVASQKKAQEDAKKQRQLKKFSKQVQHETLQQRSKQKKQSLENLKSLKKRKLNYGLSDENYQMELEKEISKGYKTRKLTPKSKFSKFNSDPQKRFINHNNPKFDSKKKKSLSRPGKNKRKNSNFL